MKKLLYLLIVSFFLSCNQGEKLTPSLCLEEGCSSFFEIDSLVSPGVYKDENKYWHISHQGIQYFTIKGKLSELHSDYLINNVPQVEVIFDSDYWVWIDSISFTVPLYSALGFFSSGDFQNPIPVGNRTYTIGDMARIFPPLNIAGYSINPNQCMDCPYSETLIGTYSKYTYHPKQQFFFDKQMVGDTAKVFVKAIFNNKVSIEHEFKIIFE